MLVTIRLPILIDMMPRSAAKADVFHAIADPTRRTILDRLRQGPVRVKDLAAGFEQSRPAISKHLKLLCDAELVIAEPAGRERVYRLQGAPLQQVAAWIDAYRTHWQVSLDNLKELMEKS
jgi:DNA-binding transcriptional ArsR family regulator